MEISAMLTGDQRNNEPAALKIRCHVCGLELLNESEKQKHLELEHMKNEDPAGVQ